MGFWNLRPPQARSCKNQIKKNWPTLISPPIFLIPPSSHWPPFICQRLPTQSLSFPQPPTWYSNSMSPNMLWKWRTLIILSFFSSHHPPIDFLSFLRVTPLCHCTCHGHQSWSHSDHSSQNAFKAELASFCCFSSLHIPIDFHSL